MAAQGEDLESVLKTKLTQLEITQGKTEAVLKAEKRNAIARYAEALKQTQADVENVRRAVEAQKISAEQTTDEITAWNATIEARTEQSDEKIEILERWLFDQKAKQESYEREERIQFEIKLHETKLKLQEELRNKNATSETTTTQTAQGKLPKLVITKFSGSYADWPRFWGEYAETIDKSSVPPVTKFSYLRELLDHRVRKTIEGLPHTAEGYNRAVSILKDRYGNENEIVNAYVKELLDLPYTPTANARKIHEFHERLSYCVQSLISLKQLHTVDGMASMTLEKLPAVRGTSSETTQSGKLGASLN